MCQQDCFPICLEELEKSYKIHSSYNVKGSVDNLIEVLGEPHRRDRKWWDDTELEWDYHTRAGNVVIIHGWQLGLSTTTIDEPFYAHGYELSHCSDSIDEIQSLLNDFDKV